MTKPVYRLKSIAVRSETHSSWGYRWEAFDTEGRRQIAGGVVNAGDSGSARRKGYDAITQDLRRSGQLVEA